MCCVLCVLRARVGARAARFLKCLLGRPHTERLLLPFTKKPKKTPKKVELGRLGLGTRFERLTVDTLGDDVWRGVRRKYWKFPFYFLPVVTWVAEEGQEKEGGGGGDAARA